MSCWLLGTGISFLGQRCFAAEIVGVGMEISHRTLRLTTTRVHAIHLHGPLPMRSRTFTAGCPAAAAALELRLRHVTVARAGGRSERLTDLIGAGESAEIRAVARVAALVMNRDSC